MRVSVCVCIIVTPVNVWVFAICFVIRPKSLQFHDSSLKSLQHKNKGKKNMCQNVEIKITSCVAGSVVITTWAPVYRIEKNLRQRKVPLKGYTSKLHTIIACVVHAYREKMKQCLFASQTV